MDQMLNFSPFVKLAIRSSKLDSGSANENIGNRIFDKIDVIVTWKISQTIQA
jgi:hypothetical protein